MQFRTSVVRGGVKRRCSPPEAALTDPDAYYATLPPRWTTTSIVSYEPDGAVGDATMLMSASGYTAEEVSRLFLEKHGATGAELCAESHVGYEKFCIDKYRYRQDWGSGSVSVNMTYYLVVGDRRTQVQVTFDHRTTGRILGSLTFWDCGSASARPAETAKGELSEGL
jgi:hypothetical protein